MNYWFIGLLVAFLPVFIFSVLGGMVSRRNVYSTVIAGSFFGAAYYFLWVLIAWKTADGFYGPLPYFGSLFLAIVLGGTIATISESGGKGSAAPAVIGAIFILLPAVVVTCQGTDMVSSQEKLALAGKIEIIDDSNSAMTPVDTAHISLVDEGMAKVAAQNALSKIHLEDGAIAGSRYSIGHGTKVFADGQLWWVFPLEFQGWLKWRVNPEVPGYLRVSAEDPFAEPQPVLKDKTGEKLHIKYLGTACWGYQLERHLRYNGYMNKYLLDYTFEPDDNWKPFYTVTVAERTIGFEGLKVLGVAVVDVQTGKIEFQEIGKIAPWIDRVVPLYVIDYNLKNWGMYSNATWWYNLLHKDKSQAPTPGWFMTYDPEHGAQWFSGFTSLNSDDHAMTGFTVTNARDGVTRFFRASGLTEQKSYDAANSLWSNFAGVEPCEMVPYNIEGVQTYVIPMKYQGQFRGVSLVALNNVNIKASGNTFDQAFASYRAVRAATAEGRIAPDGGAATVSESRGTIDRVGMPVASGNMVIFYFTMRDIAKRFQVTDSVSSPGAVLMRSGDQAVCRYTSGHAATISCDSLEIIGLNFSDDNPAQVRLNANQAQVKQEEKRVDTDQTRDQLLNSDRLKKVDPQALQQFLNSQQSQGGK
ncbi:MAG: hypothetical protein WC310_03360 [Patescibacteria group bacterium]|jgi:hypothetical protein